MLETMMDRIIVREVAALDHRAWTSEELDYLRRASGILSMEAIARHLGRTLLAVKVKSTRLGTAVPSKHPDYYTANQVAKLLGLDVHKVAGWMDAGVLPGEFAPTRERLVRRVRRMTFLLWLVKPETWIYVKPERIRAPHLRRLVLLAKSRWGDEWLNMGQAGDLIGCDPRSLTNRCRQRTLPGVRACYLGGRNPDPAWNYWYIRRSDLDGVVIGDRKGTPGMNRLKYSPAADIFLLSMRERGWSFAQIGRAMKKSGKQVAYRYACLMEKTCRQ